MSAVQVPGCGREVVGGRPDGAADGGGHGRIGGSEVINNLPVCALKSRRIEGFDTGSQFSGRSGKPMSLRASVALCVNSVSLW